VAEFDDLFQRVYDELRAIAAAEMRRERRNHTLSPTALVNELYLKLKRSADPSLEEADRLLAVASRAMRQILVDHARAKGAGKRDAGRRPATFIECDMPTEERTVDVLALHEAIEGLQSVSQRKAQLAELRCFGGATLEQAARVAGVARSTATSDWAFARAWMRRALCGEDSRELGAIQEG